MPTKHRPWLLDTQILIWLAVDPDRLPIPLQHLISDRAVPLRFSVASLWEVAIKTSLGRPGFQVNAQELRRGLLRNGFGELAIGAEHCLAVQDLPWIHRDPFDRLLVAQAQFEALVLLTADRTLSSYGESVRWIRETGWP